MKVILKADVKGTGKKGEVIEVSEGYAKNFLFKKKLAEAATESGIAEVNRKKAADAFHKAEEIKAMQALANELKGKQVTLGIKVGEGGRVFGSVTSAQIAQELSAMGYDVDKKKILLDSAIKAVGTTEVKIRLMENIETKILVVVTQA